MHLTISRVGLVVVTSVVTGLLSGCAGMTDAQPSRDAGLVVVATTTQLADFTRAVAGDDASVTQLIHPNQSVHEYDPSAADLIALGTADLLVANGGGLESWLPEVSAASGFHGTLVDTSAQIDVAHDDHDQHDDHQHDHGESTHDPHIWMNVAVARDQVRAIATALAHADPEHATAFDERANLYDSQLSSLDEWITNNIDRVPASERLFVGNHDAFDHFTEAYGVRVVGSVVESLDDHAEPSATDIDELIAAIRETGVKAIFVEASMSPKAAEAIARDTGVMVYSGADALYVDSLGPAGSSGSTYIASQVHNVRLILRSWGFTASAVPADLVTPLAQAGVAAE